MTELTGNNFVRLCGTNIDTRQVIPEYPMLVDRPIYRVAMSHETSRKDATTPTLQAAADYRPTCNRVRSKHGHVNLMVSIDLAQTHGEPGS